MWLSSHHCNVHHPLETPYDSNFSCGSRSTMEELLGFHLGNISCKPSYFHLMLPNYWEWVNINIGQFFYPMSYSLSILWSIIYGYHLWKPFHQRRALGTRFVVLWALLQPKNNPFSKNSNTPFAPTPMNNSSSLTKNQSV